MIIARPQIPEHRNPAEERARWAMARTGNARRGASSWSAQALWPCHSPRNPRFDARRPHDEFTALGRDTSAAGIAASGRWLGCSWRPA